MFKQLTQNPSIAAILFGIAAIFLLLQLGNTKTNKKKIALIVLLVVSIVFVVLLKSRVVWLGILSVLVFIKIKTKKWQLTKMLVTILAITIIAGIGIAIFYKTGSTLGRLLIYKIDFIIIKQHWLTGIKRPFNVVYNHTQANYFANNNQQNSREALLPSNGFFAFNEWLNIFIHFGIVGFIVAIAATTIFIKECCKQLITLPNKIPVIGITFFILFVALVSYPFSFAIYSCIFLCSVVYIISDVRLWLFKKHRKLITLCCYFLPVAFYAVSEIKEISLNKKIEDVASLYKNGYINNALEVALTEIKIAKENGQLYQLIAKIYFQKNNLDLSIYYIEKAHQFLCTDELHCFWGNCLTEKQLLNEANNHYTTAVNIVPCRFKNRMLLLNNFIRLKECNKALLCAKDIIELPEKIPSTQTKNYKAEAKSIYDNLVIKK